MELNDLQAQALAKEGRHQHAEQLLQGVMSINGNHIEALHQLANLYGLQQKHQQVFLNAFSLTLFQENWSLLTGCHLFQSGRENVPE